MKSESKRIKGGLGLLFICVILFIGILVSCKDIIDPAAANSLSAVIAVIGEYLYASIVLLLVVILWVIRPAGISLVFLGVLGLCDYVELSINSTLLISIGLVMFFASFAPIKQYEPLVIISKHFKLPKDEKVKDKRDGYQEVLTQLLAGLILLAIEYSIFVK